MTAPTGGVIDNKIALGLRDQWKSLQPAEKMSRRFRLKKGLTNKLVSIRIRSLEVRTLTTEK